MLRNTRSGTHLGIASGGLWAPNAGGTNQTPPVRVATHRSRQLNVKLPLASAFIRNFRNIGTFRVSPVAA